MLGDVNFNQIYVQMLRCEGLNKKYKTRQYTFYKNPKKTVNPKHGKV